MGWFVWELFATVCACVEVLFMQGPLLCGCVEFVAAPIPPPSQQAEMNEILTSKLLASLVAFATKLASCLSLLTLVDCLGENCVETAQPELQGVSSDK